MSHFEGVEEALERRACAAASKRLDEAKYDLQARYEYLKHGGEWQRVGDEAPSEYTRGFLDAMKTLGVLP